MTQTIDYDAFCRNGYTVVEKALSKREIKNIQAAIAAPFISLCKHMGLQEPISSNWDSLHKAMQAVKEIDQTLFLNAIKLSQNDPRILTIPATKKIITTLNAIGIEQPIVALKPFPIVISDALHIKNGYNLRPLHQEWAVMQGSSDGVVCWIALHDIHEKHNTLHLVPGSHTKGFREYERTKCGTAITKPALPVESPIRMNINAGDAVIFSCFTAHGSDPGEGDLRAAVTIRFNNLAAPDFIKRGYPDPSKVIIDREPENLHMPTKIIRNHPNKS